MTSDVRGHVTHAVTMTVDTRRMSEADRAGLAARSPEGHAAKSMHIRGREEEWIQIQANTFKNWVNVNLKEWYCFSDNVWLSVVVVGRWVVHKKVGSAQILPVFTSDYWTLD